MEIGVLDVGDVWPLRQYIRDRHGQLLGPSAVTVTVRLTKPDGITTVDPTVTYDSKFQWFEASPVLDVVGRWTAKWTVSGQVVGVHHEAVSAVVASLTVPTVAMVRAYLGTSATQWTDPQLQEALDAETAAQEAAVGVRAVYPANLRVALFRRVQRNLTLRTLPLGVLQGDAQAATVLTGRDPEVRRLEGRHRRLVLL